MPLNNFLNNANFFCYQFLVKDEILTFLVKMQRHILVCFDFFTYGTQHKMMCVYSLKHATEK